MDNVCKICGQEFSTGHPWSDHGIKLANYFHKFYPRYSKLTNKLIIFKNPDQYLNADFENLQEMKTWLKSAGEEGKEYILELLIKRKIKKNWIYAPGQALLRLSNLPSILYYEKQFNLPFSEICKKLGFKIKYKNKEEKVNWIAPIEIKIDTREKLLLKFPNHIKTEIGCLKFGDYSLVGDEKIVIERKSISDAAGTFSAGYDRFKRELQRAKKAGGYIVILIENSYSDFRSIEYLPQTRHIKSNYDHLSKRMRDLYEEFSNFQIVFCDGRKQAAQITEYILKLGKKIKKIDIQLLIDKKVL